MTIRNISQYIEKLCGKETLDLLGTNKELLLQKIYGQDPSRDQVKSVISDAASFASNAEEQLFYEFVQNAYDANADSLFFYANEDYLIVLNNGEPFYTDFDIFDSETIREGQLYNFLAKGKSLKRGDEKKMGKYGQGSKLLYTLLTKVDDKEENEELLIESIYNKKKGPYLISWYNRIQLANLLQKQPVWQPAQGDDYENNILFIKILMSYYPLAPGVNEQLFPKIEAINAINAFDTLVDPRRNIHFLNRGTALIIPLGKGKYNRITSSENLERVKTRLGGFASITREQERNEGKTVEHIYVMGEEVEQYEVKSVFVDFNVDGKPFYYHFAFNPIFAERNFVNLFKGLPILETKLRLGFILDSQKFDVDSSRQRINDKTKTQVQLVRAFKELVIQLRKMKKNEGDKFDYIYKSLLATRIPDGEDFAYIRNAFREVFKPFFEEFILTNSGKYEKKEYVRSYEDSGRIPLQLLGISNYYWVEPSISKDLRRHGIDIKEENLSSIFKAADSLKLQSWIKGMSKKEYSEFQKIVDDKKSESDIATFKLFRTNQGNVYSFVELQSNANVYYPIESGISFGDCEHLEDCLTGIDTNKYLSQLYGKIKSNIDILRANDSTCEDAANLLSWIISKDSTYLSKIKSEIKLMQNMHGEYLPFNELLDERPEGTILFDNYLARGVIPEVVKNGKWLLSPSNEKERCWDWVVKHWKELQANEEWGINTHKYLADVKSIYNAVKKNTFSSPPLLTLYLDSDGKPTDALHTIVNNVSKLTKDEYNLLGLKVNHLKLIPYEYVAELQEPPFKVETTYSSEIVKDGMSADETLLKVIIKITDNYLNSYRTQENSGFYYITRATSGYNYVDEVSADLQQELQSVGFYHIPHVVQQILSTERGKYRFVSNEDMLIRAINRINNPIKMLHFVKQANANVIKAFFNKLGQINIDSRITKEDPKWQVIELAVQRSTDDNDYKGTIFDLIRHHGDKLPYSITKQYVYIGENQYNIYDLNEEYETDNKTIDSFLKCLPSQNGIDFFKEHFYEGKEEEVPTSDLYDDLYNTYLTIEQLRFCIDYSIANDEKYEKLEIGEGESVTKALDMILRHKFHGFDKYFKMPDVDYSTQVYAPKEILKRGEMLPSSIHQWIDDNPTILGLFTRLKTIFNPFISVRQALLNDMPYENISAFADDNFTNEIDAMIDWAIDKKLIYVYGSERFKTAMAIIEKLPSNYTVMPFLRYTGEVAPMSNDIDKPKPLFTLERCKENCSFLSIYSWSSQFEERLLKSHKLSKFIKENIVYAYGDKELLFNHGFNNKPRWIVQTSVETKEYPEYTDPVYEIWKGMPESKGITIHTSDHPIIMSFNIMTSNSSVFSDKMQDSEYGYEVGKRVVVQHPNKGGLTLMKTIAKHIGSMDFFKEPFIALQSLYVDQWELHQQGNGSGMSNLDLTNSDLSEEQAQKTLDKISTKTAENLDKVNDITKQMDSNALEKLKDSAESIKELLDVLEKEDLKRLAEKKDKILQVLDDLSDAEEEEKESQVRQTIGFIGELIYGHYLENKQKEYVHAALQGVGEYDFEVTSDNMYVDVKTTLYSLKDGTAPFYLHRSQNVFMQQHPDAKYHIVRISLIDLNLKKSYEELRDTYGKDANPFENENLKKRCEYIAKKYWQAAQIEEFDALSPEYAIRIELKNEDN